MNTNAIKPPRAVLKIPAALAAAAIVALTLIGCGSDPATRRWTEPKKSGSVSIGVFPIEGTTGSGAARFEATGLLRTACTLEGTVRDSGDRVEFLVERAHWFSNWHDGWTEAEFSASGTLVLARNGESWTLSAPTPPRLEYPTAAIIRYRDTVIDGDEGLNLFERRWNRIEASRDLLKKKLGSDHYEVFVADKKRDRPSSFFHVAGRFLFPEVYGNADGSDHEMPPRDRRAKAEGIAWDLDYTEATFPEQFREIRDSGTLFRDWEECGPLFFLTYNWDWAFSAQLPASALIERAE
ncbi:MAG TPA: hypothetical protein PLU93_04715 [Treponemataceae bacterium]|nr:hypothetical protein [Treponemataceae bacterium]